MARSEAESMIPSIPPSTRAILAAILLIALSGCQAPLERHAFVEVVMGVEARITLFASDEPTAAEAARAAFDRMHALDRTLSNYRHDSELSRLTKSPPGATISVSHDLARMLHLADQLHDLSDGAFDITIGPAARVWKQAIREGAAPDAETLDSAWARVGWTQVELIGQDGVRFTRPGVQLDPGGIGKGDAADAAMAVLRSRSITRCLVDVGGDLAIGEPPPTRPGWWLRVTDDTDDPGTDALITITNCGVATSGPAHQHLIIDGIRHSHLLDPRTRRPVTHDLTVTIIAARASMADGIASIVSVLGPMDGLRLVESLPDVECRLVTPDDVITSSGFAAMTQSSP